MERCAISETGTGFACAKLSEAHSSRRVAQVVRVTPNPLTPSHGGKGNRSGRSRAVSYPPHPLSDAERGDRGREAVRDPSCRSRCSLCQDDKSRGRGRARFGPLWPGRYCSSCGSKMPNCFNRITHST